MKLENFVGSKLVPLINLDIEVFLNGDISHEGNFIDIVKFNVLTGLAVGSVEILQLIVFHSFNWPPVYWKYLVALKNPDGIGTVESSILGIKHPVESIEYPGFYLIPYYGNYLINKTGRLIKKSTGEVIESSKGPLGYHTFRMTGDDKNTQNRLRHRILAYTFLPYSFDVVELDVNHIDGIPGHDELSNLEWLTRSANILHAIALGLRTDNKAIEAKDVVSGKVFIFDSCSQAGRFFSVTETTISNRAKTNGFKVYNGFQFRFFTNGSLWPIVEAEGSFVVEFEDGKTKLCSCLEAARLAGVTRTSLLRALREGRNYGKTKNKVSRVLSPLGK